MIFRGKLGGLALASVSMLALVPGAAVAKDTVIHAARMIDGTGAPPKERVSIVIKDDRIAAIEAGYVDVPGATVIELPGTVLPGLIDTHVHIAGQADGENPIVSLVTHSELDQAYKTVGYARATLMAGFTAIRDVAAPTDLIVSMKKAINSGEIAGPRMWVSGAPLGPIGGHGDQHTGLSPVIQGNPEWNDGLVTGADDAVRVVREHHRRGTDLIKLMPSGGVMSVGDDPQAQTMSDAEIKAAIDAAHALGMKVAAHVHGREAIDHVIELGADSIEHGTYAGPESYALFKKHGVYLVPTLLIGEAIYEIAKTHPEQLNKSSAAKALTIAPLLSRNVSNAYKAGVKIAFGTDESVVPHGKNAREFALLTQAGLTPMDAILTATRNAADLIGAPQDIGSIQPGRFADIVAVQGDPLSDINQLTDIKFVMKGGIVYKAGGIDQGVGAAAPNP